jgi:hypothetical protein
MGETAMLKSISIRCLGCRARIKAPVQLLGQSRPCPGCGQHLRVQRPQPCEDAGPLLTYDDRPAPARRRFLY